MRDRDRWLDQATRIWSFTEASLWWVIPDAWVLGLSATYPERARRLATVCWRWSALGVLFSWALCSALPGGMRSLIFSLPFTLPVMAEWVHQNAQDWGIWGCLYQPLSNIPVKVWVLEGATHLQWPLALFLPLVVFARALRMYLAAEVGGWVGRRLPAVVRKHYNVSLGLYSLLILYLLWWTSRSIVV